MELKGFNPFRMEIPCKGGQNSPQSAEGESRKSVSRKVREGRKEKEL